MDLETFLAQIEKKSLLSADDEIAAFEEVRGVEFSTITAHSCKDAMEVISADRFGILSMGQAFITFSAFAKNSIFLFHSIVIRLVAFSLLT